MFDIGFSELMVIAVVALIVIGPERLPKVARTLGHLFGRMQRYVNDVKADISREMELEELRKLQTSMQEAARSFEQSVTSEVRSAETELQKIAQEANPTPVPPSSPAHETTRPLSETAVPSSPASVPGPGQLTAAEASAQLQLELDSNSGDKRV
jgi:sec-independent protein translocase protein TatB